MQGRELESLAQPYTNIHHYKCIIPYFSLLSRFDGPEQSLSITSQSSKWMNLPTFVGSIIVVILVFFGLALGGVKHFHSRAVHDVDMKFGIENRQLVQTYPGCGKSRVGATNNYNFLFVFVF